jgi:hypothetical protein
MEATQEQARTAQAALIASDRPWIEVVGLSIVELQFGQWGVSASMEIRTKNTGRSPALRAFVDAEIVVDTNDNEVGDHAAAMCDRAARNRDRFGVEGVVFPDGTRTVRLLRNISPGEIDRGVRRIRQREARQSGSQPGAGRAEPDRAGFAIVGCADYTFPSGQAVGQIAFVYDLARNCGAANLVLPCDFEWPVTGIHPGDALAVEANDFYGFAR